MKEASFMRAVLNKLPPKVHSQSMTSASLTTAGTPDRYFDYLSDLWVEFKWNAGLPRVLDTGRMLSDLQKRWLARRYEVGKNCLVIVGFPYLNKNCGVVLSTPGEWLNPIPRIQFVPMIMTIPQIADHVLSRVTVCYDAHHPHTGFSPATTGRRD